MSKTTADRNAIKRTKLAEAEAYAANPFDNYDGISTPEAAVWSEDSRYMRWTLETNQRGSRLAFSRNNPNPNT
jgi:hypothetical protein